MPPHEPPTSATCGAGSAGAREVSGTILQAWEGRGAIVARVRGCAVVIGCGGGAPSAGRRRRGGAGAAQRVASSFAGAGMPMLPGGRPHWSPWSPASSGGRSCLTGAARASRGLAQLPSRPITLRPSTRRRQPPQPSRGSSPRALRVERAVHSRGPPRASFALESGRARAGARRRRGSAGGRWTADRGRSAVCHFAGRRGAGRISRSRRREQAKREPSQPKVATALRAARLARLLLLASARSSSCPRRCCSARCSSSRSRR